MIIDCISDLHGAFPKLEGGDLLIIAGDCTSNDTLSAWDDFLWWFDDQDYRKKVMVAGNHDNFCTKWKSNRIPEEDPETHIWPRNRKTIEYLCDSGTEFEGLKIWGSPWTSWFHGINPKCKAFTLHGEEKLQKKWALIPDGIDILVTHSPPLGWLDENRDGIACGSLSLSQELYRIRPKLHVFGHIHESYGMYRPKLEFCGLEGYPISVNASVMDRDYEPINAPIRVIL